MDFNEQQKLVVGIGERDIWPAHEVLVAFYFHKILLLPLKAEPAFRVFVERTLVVHVPRFHGVGVAQWHQRAFVALGPTRKRRGHFHPPLLL